ncbi:MAG TPA: GAF domain-containing sensor histidine kinase [Candidatus Saccharimonadales bacterium]|nr:GAF domain-containing sensor histidine kinase [Candidatus Saccharimonadales bacterium]
MNVYLIVDLIAVISLIILALAALLKNATVRLNRIFATFVGFVSIWIIANYVSNDTHLTPQIATIANYLVFGFSFCSAVYLLRLVVEIADDTKSRALLARFYLLLVGVALISFTPLVVAGVKIQGSVYAVKFGPAISIYYVSIATLIVSVMYVLRQNINRASGETKKRLKVLFISLCWALPGILLANVILPAITGWFGLSNIGLLPVIIAVYGLFYNVIRHRLFDLRLIIVRSLVYALTLGVISLFYGIVSAVISRYISSNTHSLVLRDGLDTLLIIVVVLMYSPLRVIFNKVTNSLFFRDAYDPQVFISKLNKVLVENIELDKLMKFASQVIADNLKSEYCMLGVNETQFRRQRFVGNVEKEFPDADLTGIRSLMAHLKGVFFITDLLTQDQSSLQRLLRKNDVALLVRITPSTTSGQTLGYIVLGQKKSGNSYTNQDITILQIISHELLIAVQNALHFEEIQHFNITLQQKVDKATRELRHTNERLRLLDQTKDDFISMASHQLRTPLTAVKGYVSMVLDGDAGKLNPMQRKLLNQSFISSQRMVYLIADLLNISRLKTGKFVIEPAPTNLAQITAEEVSQLMETAKGRDLELTFVKPEHFPVYMLDETKLRQVIMNFVDNAIYYTPAGGHIVVALEDKPQSVELTVTDDGIGVPKAEQHHLFSKFYRAPNARRARPDGTGLGLFMAKKVIIEQGGAVLFKSMPGKGSTFGFSFAKSRLAVPPSNNSHTA